MPIDLSALTAEVERDRTVNESAATLLAGLSAKIEENKADPVALQALADQLKTNSDALAEAVSANTPAEPPA